MGVRELLGREEGGGLTGGAEVAARENGGGEHGFEKK